MMSSSFISPVHYLLLLQIKSGVLHLLPDSMATLWGYRNPHQELKLACFLAWIGKISQAHHSCNVF
ncbi:hypothetical protein JYQ62_17180 [Nostoc sp. UHCC 0702]|nr:hypothetical protein JYQ62_17180 [Nostoc sp. UHCC 0702]